MRVSTLRGAGGQLQSSAACRQHVGVARPKPGTGWSRVVLVNCQLSGGQIDARDAKRDSIVLLTTPRKRSSYLRRNGLVQSPPVHGSRNQKLLSIADYEYALAVCAHFWSPAVSFDCASHDIICGRNFVNVEPAGNGRNR
jgi:hypothetical protein